MMWSFSLRWLIPFSLVVLLLAACSDDAEDSSGTTLASTTTASETTTTTAAPTTTTTVALQGHGPFEVTSTVVSHETTQDIWVWAPDADGSWPIVYALHGTGGTGDGLAVTATELASYGYVVFAPTYRTEMDLECGWRYSLSIAEEYGGDLDEPTAYIGHSLGASMVLIGGLDEDAYGPGGTYDVCFEGGVRPTVLVPISGCYYEYEGDEFVFDPAAYSDQGVEIVLVVGTEDAVCEPWQSQDATEVLQAAGYDARLVEVEGGNHSNVVFYEVVDGEWLPVPDDPIGEEVVQIILDAIQGATP
jgi:acetyl esterase/lipase